MSYRYARMLCAALLAGATGGLVSASTPMFWQVSTRADFIRGEVEQLAIDAEGRLSLGPTTTLVHDSAAPFLWTLASGADGVVYAGSGNEGKVFRIDRDGKTSLLFDAPEMEVHALAVAADGSLYAATSPDGQVYRIDAKGTATPFFKPEGKYIWALAVDRSGTVYAGTGEKGVIYRITADGKGTPFYRTGATNVVALAFDHEGRLLAGTEAPGRLLRIDGDGRGFVLLDTAFREVHAIRVDRQGVIYATAVAARPGAPAETAADAAQIEPPRPTAVPTVSAEITGITVIDVSAAGATTGDVKPTPPRPGARGSRGAVYRILPDGLWDTVWESSEDTPYDLTFDADGALLLATGSKGRLFRVAGDPPRVSLVGRAAAQQVTRFLSTARGDILYSTANPGRIFGLSAGRSARGTYESEVKDAQTVATWGTISWRAAVPAGSRIELQTRSGNSDTPDETWSPWSAPYRRADGEPILSPKARYLQWRATLTAQGASPVLTSVTAAYLPRNLRPRVASITVHPPGIVFQKPYSTGEAELAGFEDGWPDTRPSPTALAAGSPALLAAAGPAIGRRTFQKGLQAFAWKGEDDNEDRLVYDILYRREGETSWQPLRRGLTDPMFVWDTTAVPDGSYLVRIVASDAPSNHPSLALVGEADSAPFDVDNSAPAIRVLSVRRDGTRTTVAVEVTDDQSPIQRVDCSIDAGRWRALYPKDGICDSRAEVFELTVDGSPASIVIRAMDTMNNVSTSRAETPGKQ